MKLAPDKLAHLKGGALALVGAAGLIAAMLALGVSAVALALVVAGVFSAGSVEGAQWVLNRRAAARGEPLPHEVSLADAAYTAAPCLLAALAWELAARGAFSAWGL